jgi:hypothetical protein
LLGRGIVVADTKLEFGRDADGALVLADEVLTPDSSRFWPADEYEAGRSQNSFDKQYVRDHLDSTGWDHTPPPPELPAEVIASTRARYVEAYERISEREFEAPAAAARGAGAHHPRVGRRGRRAKLLGANDLCHNSQRSCRNGLRAAFRARLARATLD